MTLRATPKEEIPAEETSKKIESAMKINSFTQMVKRTQSYLQMVIEILDGGSRFPPNGSIGCPILLIGKMDESNPYGSAFREIFEYKCILRFNGPGDNKSEVTTDTWWSVFTQSDYGNLDKLESIFDKLEDSYNGYCIARIMSWWSGGYSYIRTNKITELKYYIVFWNLFLSTLDDSLYNEQFPIIADLAYYFGFDEHMMRDWCRAVEYVLSGNQLSETCDLHCDTVEGAKFFLHSED